jgi:Copper type II ascorbate-dependent monooxygenase, C-terminal domain
VLVYAREPGQPARTPVWSQIVPPPPPARTRASAPRRTDRGALIATTAPGTNATVFRPGSALLIKAGSTITFQMHYTTNGEATTDQTRVGFVFAKQRPSEEVQTGAFLNAMFTLPPDSRESVESVIEFTNDVTVWSLFPHSHLRGRAWEYTAIYPDGKKEVVLSVPKYDFNWQPFYYYAEPLRFPKGTRLQATAWYDNSVANKSNPDHTKAVKWGEQTWDEMQYSGIIYTVNKH